MAFALVAGNADASTFFQSEAGFTITYPARYRTDQAQSTSTKLYIYLADSTPVDAITVSTDTVSPSTRRSIRHRPIKTLAVDYNRILYHMRGR